MAALPNLSGLSLGGGGGDEEEGVAPLDTGLVVQHASGGPSPSNQKTGFSQLLAEYPLTVPQYNTLDDPRPYRKRNELAQVHKGNLLELGLAAQAMRFHYSQQQWPMTIGAQQVPQPGPQNTADDFVHRWLLLHSPGPPNAPRPVLEATRHLNVFSYPAIGSPYATQLGTPEVGYEKPYEGVLRSANETMLISTKREQRLAPGGASYGMATYNEMWFINTREAQINMWPQMRQHLHSLIETGPKLPPTHRRVITYLTHCLQDLVRNAQRLRPLYMYGGNAIQNVLKSNYEDLGIMAQNRANPNNLKAYKRTFLFARRKNTAEFKAFGEVDCLKVEHNTPRAELDRAQADLAAAQAANQAAGTPATQQAEAAAQDYFDRASEQMQSNPRVAPWFTLELQQMNYPSMCRYTDWTTLSSRRPTWLNYQSDVDKIFAYLAPPDDINTNPLFGDASKTVPWPETEEGELNGGPLDPYRGMSLYETVRAIDATRAAPGFVEPA